MVLESVVQYLSELGQNILTAARNFTFKDAIDVAIVTVLLYSAIKLVRETRAGQLVKGIILLIVLFLISYQLDLLMLNAILRAFLSSGIVIVVILFQPEIRKALEQVGHSKVVQSLANTVSAKDKEEGKAETRKAIQGVVDATQILQQLRMGALIVFERREKLNDISRTGTRVNADVTAELIKNIFYPKAPLHDGAMIVVDSRIHAAGCVLPLSASQRLSRELGTRHRAAVGMSETADCVCVVVSEETGSISVAVGGMLKRHLAPEMLQRVLEAELMPAREEETGKKNKLSLRKERNK